MAKDPAFLFYTGDFTTGTQFFTDEQVGKYIRLLMAQHQLGHLEEKHMIMICKTYDKDIFSKFIKDDKGLYYNERLDNEIVRRKNYSESRSENRKQKKISLSYVNHMETKTTNVLYNNINTTKIFRIEECLTVAMNDARWVKANNATTKDLNQFNDLLEKRGIYEKNPLDYKTHFANWNKSGKKELPPEVNQLNEKIKAALKNQQ